MNSGLKVFLYLFLLTGSCVFGGLFVHYYNRLTAESQQQAVARIQARDEDRDRTDKSRELSPHYSKTMLFGGFMGISILGFGFLFAHDVAAFFGSKASRLIYNDSDAEAKKNLDYEKADLAWRNGDYLGAVQMLREFVQKNPAELHAAIRIGEIYEKDMANPLAAALEYEEVLKHKFNAERWAWLAIRLSNLYSGKLNQPEKSLALLRRIDADHGNTKAAAKARKRLAQMTGNDPAGLAGDVSDTSPSVD
jgi:hypothetical protein